MNDEKLNALLSKCALKDPPGSLSGYTAQVMAKLQPAPAPLRLPRFEVGFALAAAAVMLFVITRPPATAPESVDELLSEIQAVDRFVVAKAVEEQEMLEEGIAYDGLYEEELLDTIRRSEEVGLQVS